MHATAPGFTATRALHACLRCDERYPLALNPKNSNANLSYQSALETRKILENFDENPIAKSLLF